MGGSIAHGRGEHSLDDMRARSPEVPRVTPTPSARGAVYPPLAGQRLQ
jgi:hypothetical protein